MDVSAHGALTKGKVSSGLMENTNMHTPMCYNHYSLSFIINTNNTSALNAHLR